MENERTVPGVQEWSAEAEAAPETSGSMNVEPAPEAAGGELGGQGPAAWTSGGEPGAPAAETEGGEYGAPVSETVGAEHGGPGPVPGPSGGEPGAPVAGSLSGGSDGPAPAPAKKTFLRASGSWTDILPIAAMLSVIVTMFGAILSEILDSTLIPAEKWGMQLLGNADGVEFLLEYFEFFGIWLVFILVISVFKNNWPMWKAFFYNRHGNNLKAVGAGIALGFGMNGFCILMSVLMGDIKLSFGGFDPLVFFVFLLCVFIQSGAEEIIDRRYLYQKLRRRYRWPAIAVLGNALVFMALHMGNPSVTWMGLLQVFLIGVLFSLIVYYWDSLWTVIWAHAAWNFSQSIVFGLPNSGIVSKYSVFKLEAASARSGIFYETGFGVEGSLGANVLIGIVIAIILIYGFVTKRGECRDHWQELEEREAGKSHVWEAVVLTVIMAAVIVSGYLAIRWFEQNADEIQQVIEEMEQAAESEQSGAGQSAGAGTPAQPAEGQEKPGAQQPGVAQPATENPAQPGAGQPATENPAQPGTEQPATEKPAQPAQPGNGNDQPAGEAGSIL